MSFLSKLKDSLTKAVADLAPEEPFQTDEATRKARIEVCNTCPSLFKPTRQCKLCFCFVEAKARMPNASCPANKW